MAGDWQNSAAHLLREAFEGQAEGQDYTWFVEGKEGIFDALNSVDAEAASKKSVPESPTIAAHAFHLLYILRLANSHQGRPAPEGDWESTWLVQQATPREWETLETQIDEEYRLLIPFYEAADHAPDHVLPALSLLPHVAYHLGALRALLRLV